MNIKQCANCGKLFQPFGSNICADCEEKKDKCYITVRNYVYENPRTSVAEIIKNTDVKEKWVLEFLKEERLTLCGLNGSLTCEQCGKPVNTGRICQDCRERLQKELDRAVPKKQPQTEAKEQHNITTGGKGRMHVLLEKDSLKNP